MIRKALLRIAIVPALAGLPACGDQQDHAAALTIVGADPGRGRALIQAYGCGTCHTIGGVRGARGKVGPELRDYAQQHLLAGFLPNTPQNLIAWLVDPVALKPQTGMPAQGLTEAEARHVASYLYTLGAGENPVYPPDPPLPLRGHGETTADLPKPAPRPSETEPRTRRIVPHQAANPDVKS
ncbi:c-type cytochrome [Microvirga mediterraneensis]|jgi:mono/diheme cytochrome c family protein|uniref:Cytochrome c n=1 Tax=Microvirga mediterraneensis TaxID=2754695 RepID=A0A838BLI6_9HYPH|nr:cytochrome c [Microvirga mediterraneensis]MBA1156407.1 cytochrome c [Microvirga mediterraneensis]